MNEMLKTINTETLSAVISDVNELEAGLTEIFTKYDGMNIRSIVALFHRYNCQVEVNYAHPKGCELVMLPMLPWQAYSTIGRLTFGLPHRLFPTNRDV